MMKGKNNGYTPTKFSEFGGVLAEEAGRKYANALIKMDPGKAGALKEKYGIGLKKGVVLKEGIFKEDITTTNSAGAFVTLLSDTLYFAALDQIQDVLDLVNVNEDMVGTQGFGAYQIPRMEPTIAAEVAEGSVVTYFDEGTTPIVVTPRKVVSGTALTWEILKRGMNDFAKFVLRNAADSIGRKLASDIVNGLSAGADSSNTVTGGLSYDNVIDAETNVIESTSSGGVKFGFIPTHLVVSGTGYGTLAKDTDWKQHVFFEGVIPGSMIPTVNRPQLMFSTMKVVRTPFLTDALGLVVDARKAAILVK